MLLRCCFCTLAMTLALSAQVGGRGGSPIQLNPGGPMQPAGNQPPPATDCAASGTVINAVTGEPIAHAMVSLNPQSNSGSATDSNGQWSVTNQTCGRISPTATHSGFLNGTYGGTYGQQSPQSAPKRVELVSGSPTRDLKITLIPEGTISGRVQDENGDPIEEAQITVARVAVMNGERALINGGGAVSSDAEGNFRTDRLPPGRYIVCAHSAQRSFPAGGGEALVYSSDCYPGPLSAGPSTAAPLDGGREMRVGLTLRSAPGLHVRGTVSGMPEGPRRGSVTLLPFVDQGRLSGFAGLMGGSNVRPGAVASDGTFDIAGVTPGDYFARMVVGQPGLDSTGLFAEQVVHMGNSDVDNVHLSLQPSGSVTGTVHVMLTNPAADGPGASNPNVIVNVNSDPLGLGGVSGRMQWDTDHLNFTFPAVQPGRYVLNASIPGNNGTYIKSATLNGQDVIDQSFTVNGTTGPIEIVISDDSGTLTANVTDAGDQPVSAMVILKPSSGQAIIAAAGDDGKLTRGGLPTGQYRVWAFDDIRNVPYNEDDWMTQYAGPAQTVTISATGSADLTLKRITAPTEP